MLHNKNNFIVAVSNGDREVFLKDVNGKSTFSITPTMVTITYVDAVSIYVKTKGTDNILKIDFSKNSEAIEAMAKLKTALHTVEKNMANSIEMDVNFHHIQSVPSTIWTFMHELNRRTPVVTMDNNGVEIIGLVEYIDNNNVKISFNQAVSGHAWI